MNKGLSKKYIHQCFKQSGVQLSPDTLDQIIYILRQKVSKMALRSKECNIKRLTVDLLYLALGKYDAKK